MKKLVLCSLIFLGAYNSANAYERCGMPRGYACGDFYSRFDAFKKLQANENSLNDAEQNLTIIEAVQNRLNLNLEYLVDNFLYIQNSVGGADFSSEARLSFDLLVNEVYGQNRLHDLADSFVDQVKAENSLGDAQSNFRLIAKHVRSGKISFYNATKLFLSILQLEGGSDFTSEAKNTFVMLMDQSHKYQLNDLFSSYQLILHAENSKSDAIQNFLIILLAAEKCGNLLSATNDFIQVLDQVGGSDYTTEARSLYRRLYGI